MIRITFAGHRNVYSSDMQEKVRAALDEILREGEEFEFFSGHRGEFDELCEHEVQIAKSRHPSRSIKLFLVEPYMRNELNTGKAYYEERFDEIIIPMELAKVHYKSAIKKRNQWMIAAAIF